MPALRHSLLEAATTDLRHDLGDLEPVEAQDAQDAPTERALVRLGLSDLTGSRLS